MTNFETLCYLAGYFDGEGCVSFPNAKSIRVSINSADRESLALFHELYGGHFNTRDPQPGERRQIFRWEASGLRAQKFLIDVLPYLKAKRDVALLGLVPTFGIKGQRVSEEEKLLRSKIQREIQIINQRVTVCLV
jgi:hypothetical protein